MASSRPILLALPDQLSGARIVLRRYTDSDAAALCATIREAQSHLHRWLPGFEQPWSLEETLAFVRQAQARWMLREAFHFAIWHQHTDQLLGALRLRPTDWSLPAFDVAYWLHPAAEGHGYLSEAVRLVTQLAFETLGAQRVAIVCDQHNARSRRLPERLGYVLEGCLRNNGRGPDGVLFDMLIFALTPVDYQRARGQWSDVSGDTAGG